MHLQVVGAAIALASCGGSSDGSDEAPYLSVDRPGGGSTVVLTVERPPVYFKTDPAQSRYLVADGSGWRPVVDERPTDGGAFVLAPYSAGAPIMHAHGHGHGHGAASCLELIGGRYLSWPREYVRTGTTPDPDAGADAPPLVVIEARPVSGAARLPLTFYTEPSCATAREQTFDF